MPQPHTLKIADIFSSIQGEGLRQGEPTIFIRLSGCNLRCSFCDTKYAWRKGRNYTVSRILLEIRKIRKRFPAEWVCLTGGEPLLQDLSELVKNLKKEHLKIQIETNATFFQPLPVDWHTISPKPRNYFYRPEYKSRAKEIKLLVTRSLPYDVVKKIRREFPARTPLLLQIESNLASSLKKGLKYLKLATQDGLRNIRVSAQLHKFFGLP
jgi:organic radical activating enzyme